MPSPTPDVLVLGLGPAGRAVAHRCAAAGLSVVAVDPNPERHWRSTYGAWADELPAWLDPAVIAARAPSPASRVHAARRIDREYVVLDTDGLQSLLTLDSVRVIRGRAEAVTARGARVMDEVLPARIVIDARGLRGSPALPEQTAFGAIVASEAAESVLEGESAWFMDWRLDNGAEADEPASFLYAVPLGGGKVLLEETCLAGLPGLSQQELRTRLHARLAARGLTLTGEEEIERVRFPLHPARPEPALRNSGTGPIGYGARGGLTHPASGYTVATALAWADVVAAQILDGTDPAARLWTRQACAVHALRMRGLYVLLALRPTELREFFDAFFHISDERQRDFLSTRTSAAAVGAAMTATFFRLPMRLRFRVARASLRWRIAGISSRP